MKINEVKSNYELRQKIINFLLNQNSELERAYLELATLDELMAILKKSQNTQSLNENLRQWFREKWVRFGPDGRIRGQCARGDAGEGKPKCLPQAKAHALGKKGRKYAASKKRREDPNPERSGPAINVATKKKTNEKITEGHYDQAAEKYRAYLIKTMPQLIKFLERSVEGWQPTEEQLLAAIETGYTVMKHTGNIQQAGRAMMDELNSLHKISQDRAGLTESQLDELRCWTGYERVPGKRAGAPGSCRRRTNEEYQVAPLDNDTVRRITVTLLRYWEGRDLRNIRIEPAEGDSFRVTGSYPFGESIEVEYEFDRLNRKIQYVDKKIISEQRQLCPECGGAAYSDRMLAEKQDACYHKVRSRYRVWPSAYASGALVQCRKKGAKNWGNKSK